MKAAKFLVGLVTAIAVALSTLGLTGTAGKVVTIVLAVAGAIGVYLVPNAPAQVTGGKYVDRPIP